MLLSALNGLVLGTVVWPAPGQAQENAIELPRSAVTTAWSGEIRAHADRAGRNNRGPLAASAQLAPGLATLPGNAEVLDAELRGHWHAPAWPTLSVQHNVLLSAHRNESGTTSAHARANELYVSRDLDAWQFSAGKKIVTWDVGYGFRPNDVVQQEARRTLLTVTPEGRSLIQVEHFSADRSTALVWVHPHTTQAPADTQRFADESALAARGYHRDGVVDTYLFGRLGHHTGLSAGAAAAWVATDALELHASARLMQRHDAWTMSNAWTVTTQGPASQWLIGLQWTGEARQSLLFEAWHDGTALSRSEWRDWSQRNMQLQATASLPGLPASARTGLGGQLAWQASPLDRPVLHRDQVYLRLSWQPQPWQWTVDTLYTPADGGHLITAGLEWQGDRVRVNAAWRVMGGPEGALLRQLPTRRQAVLAATWAF